MLERPLMVRDRGRGSIPYRVRPKTLKLGGLDVKLGGLRFSAWPLALHALGNRLTGSESV